MVPVGEGAGDELTEPIFGIVILKGISGFSFEDRGGLGTLLMKDLSINELNHIFMFVDGNRMVHLLKNFKYIIFILYKKTVTKNKIIKI